MSGASCKYSIALDLFLVFGVRVPTNLIQPYIHFHLLVADLPESTPWFPRKMIDLDTFADKVLEMGEELSSDHPGAKDPVYRARRNEITQIAKTYKT